MMKMYYQSDKLASTNVEIKAKGNLPSKSKESR